jgi:hypothetical protein
MVSRDHIVAALYQSRRYEAAIDAARLMIRMPPDHPPSDSWFAVAPGHFGRMDEARAELRWGHRDWIGLI